VALDVSTPQKVVNIGHMRLVSARRYAQVAMSALGPDVLRDSHFLSSTSRGRRSQENYVFIDTGQNTIEKQRHSFHAGILCLLVSSDTPVWLIDSFLVCRLDLIIAAFVTRISQTSVL
jgi:hypothetical protein